ncbi:MAG: PD40 domain-containing protein, partial [Anaerolineaceae bacterium]|nr:PD40 domain-containing protein [Anaerolineaceae bacterium]
EQARISSSSLVEPAPQSTRQTTSRRVWTIAGIITIALLLIFWGLSAILRKPDLSPASAAAGLPTTSSSTATTVGQMRETAHLKTPTLPLRATLTPVPIQPSALPSPSPQPQPTLLGGAAGKIAFASDRSGSVQIWIMNASDPSIRQQVTKITGGACQPAWSPDGRQIAFVTPCNGPRLTYPGAKIKIIDLQSSQIRDLELQGGAFEPDWSPDGETIAYTTFLGSKTQIYTVNLTDLSTKPLSRRGNKNKNPDWSPDGQYVAFTSDYQGIDEIWRMRKDGTSQEMLTQAGPLKYLSEPDWSPDGKQILAAMKEINQSAPINVLVLIDRANPRPGGKSLLQNPTRMEDGVFSPDGQLVAFWTALEGDNMEILITGMDATITRLTNHEARDFQPAWCPSIP